MMRSLSLCASDKTQKSLNMKLSRVFVAVVINLISLCWRLIYKWSAKGVKELREHPTCTWSVAINLTGFICKILTRLF